jgi:two-component system phosphate regulon sensor histidine kinase PhoR
MGKRVFLLITILMSVALIGIIFVQVFWIKNTIQITNTQFTSNVKFALAKVSEEIKSREFSEFYNKLNSLYQQGEKLKDSDVRSFIYEKIDTTNHEKYTYSQSIIEANYKIPTEFFDNDSINFKEIFSKEKVVVVKNQTMDDNFKNI